MSWWDGASFNRIRVLRDSLRADKLELANAPMSTQKRRALEKRVGIGNSELSQLLLLKRKAEQRRRENQKTGR